LSDHEEQRRDCLERWDVASGRWEEAQVWLRQYAAPVSHWMIDALELQPGDRVLELAAGPGETGFLAAELIAPGGSLICSDQSDAMLKVARARAAELGLSDVDFRVINAESIALPVASIDAVLCRWGYMLMIDPQAAFVETRRVLSPGGRLALAVWDTVEANPWLAIPVQVIAEHGLGEPIDPQAPGAFALSDPDTLTAHLEEAGFTEIEIDAVDLERRAPNFEAWWEMQLDLSPSGEAVRKADPAVASAVAAEVAHQLGPYTAASGELVVPSRTLVALAGA
jgi:ubiquinone/menaquinone biosynthesis C-methylase UbiE